MKRAAPERVRRAARPALTLTAALLLAAAFVAPQATAAGAAPRRASVAEYRERVREALAIVEEEAAFTADEEVDLESEAEALAGVRQLLPVAERVERAGGPVEVDNGWLHALLDEYERTADDKTGEERAAALLEVAARLRALDARLGEGEAPAAARDKDAEKGRLNTILRRPEYSRRERQGGALQRQLESFFEWLRGLIPDFRPLRPGTRGGLSRAALYVIFGLAAAVVAYVLWLVWRRRERGPKSVSLREARVVLGERLEADQTAADLLAEAERLAAEGQLRAAIRKAYVALLCELGDRKVIGLAQHKTNRDYLQAVRQRAPRLYPEMLPLTFNFELHWYGAQDASPSDWADFRARCQSTLRAF